MTVTPEMVNLFDAACRAKTRDEATRYLGRIGATTKNSTEWCRKAICYWAAYFSHAVRLRVEKVYESSHPVFGPATRGPMDPTQAFLLGTAKNASVWPMRPPPHPNEP